MWQLELIDKGQQHLQLNRLLQDLVFRFRKILSMYQLLHPTLLLRLPYPTLEGSMTIGPVSIHRYPSKTVSIDSNLGYPQQTDTVFIDSHSPGSTQYSKNNGEKFTGIPDSTNFESNRKTTVTTQDFSTTSYPSTQYADNLDKISVVTNPTAGSPYTDEYYDEPRSVSSKPKVGQVYLNQQYPGVKENFDGKNKYQETYSPVNNLLPNQYTEKKSSPSSADISPLEYGSTPKYSSTIDNLRPKYDIRTHPERIQAESDRTAVIVNYKNILTPEGFEYNFDTSNGIHADESGTAIDGVKAQGSYSYTGDDGKVYSIVYTADENGFVPRGDHLPTAPPIPEAILKVIEQATINKQLGIIDDGSYDDAKYGHGRYQGSMRRIPQIQFSNTIQNVPVNKEDNLIGRQEGNTPVNIEKNLDKDYIGDENELQYSAKKSYSSDDGNHFLSDNDQINNNDVLTSGRVQDVHVPVFKGSLEQSTDNSELSKGKSVPLRPDYTAESQQLDKTTPAVANKNNQNNVGLFGTPTYDEFPSTPQETFIRKGYGQDVSQPSYTGYEYNHPQNVFRDNDQNNLKSGFSNRKNDETKSEDKVNNKGKTPKPFMTPNVSFNFNSRKTDDTMAKRPLDQNMNRPMTTSEDGAIYTQKGNNDFNQRGTSTDYNNASDNADNENIRVTNREFSTRKPYGSTSSSSQNYEAPYTSKEIDNGGQRYDSPTPTLRSQYDSTTPLSSDISRITPSSNSRYYSQTTPTQYSTTLRPSFTPEIYGTTSRRPTSSPESYGSRITGYRGDPGANNDDTYYKQPIPQAGYQDESKSRYGTSSPPNFRSQSSTESVIGEDFSGPKQSQRFEPGRGYYY